MEKRSHKNIFIAPLNWGLGHATRNLPLIKAFLARGDKVYIAAHDRAKMLLESEVPHCEYVDFPEYPIRYPQSRFFVTRFMFIIFPQMLLAMYKEKKRLRELHNKYQFDYIISDNRFCLYLKGVKSYLISHQLRYKLPKSVAKLEFLPEYFTYSYFKNYDKILVPDIDDPDSLTGELSHNMRYLPDENLNYGGVLNDITSVTINSEKDIDYFIIVSGPEPQRTKLERIIFKQVNSLPGKIVVALGMPEKDYKIRQGNATFYTYLNREQMHNYLQRSKFVIARPGYTTVMELIQFGLKGLFIPTPGQIEQVYLAKYYEEKEWCRCVSQYKLDLVNDVEKAKSYPGFPASLTNSKENVKALIEKFFN
jgi:uncharacterized protein (TIGR00661 family)